MLTAHRLTALTNQRRSWMMCYLVISRKLRRVERSSRRLICLWHWLQKKSSASSLRKLWKQSGREAGALERGDREEEEEGGSGEWRTRREVLFSGGGGHLGGAGGFSESREVRVWGGDVSVTKNLSYFSDLTVTNKMYLKASASWVSRNAMKRPHMFSHQTVLL